VSLSISGEKMNLYTYRLLTAAQTAGDCKTPKETLPLKNNPELTLVSPERISPGSLHKASKAYRGLSIIAQSYLRGTEEGNIKKLARHADLYGIVDLGILD